MVADSERRGLQTYVREVLERHERRRGFIEGLTIRCSQPCRCCATRTPDIGWLALTGCGIGERVRDLLRERFGHRVYIWP